MSDILKAFDTTGHLPTGPSYAHPLGEDIIRESSSLLSDIPEGMRLLKYAKDHDIKFNVATGKEPGYRYGDQHTLFLICPAQTKAVDLEEMACNLGLAIHEIELAATGHPRPNTQSGSPDLPQITFNHLLDIIYEMCKMVVEFESAGKSGKLVDLVEKLGHGDIYRGIRSGKNKQELAEVLRKILDKN